MTSLAALFSYYPPLNVADVQAMIAARPDTQASYSQWQHDRVALIQTLDSMWTFAASGVCQHGDCAIVADVRLDNRGDLLRRLSCDPADPISDAALILRAYLCWEDDCPAYLLGDFAFVIWDGRQNRLFCARDPLGVRPLYYAVTASGIALASDTRPLLALPDVSPELDPVTVAAHLEGRAFSRAEHTFYAQIRQLPPAHALTVPSDVVGQVETRRFWFPEQIAPEPDMALTDAVHGLRERLHAAVQARLRTNAPIGSHISGGLDSGGVTALAAHHLTAQGRSLIGYSWSPPVNADYPPLPHDERALIDAIGQMCGLTWHPIMDDDDRWYRFLQRPMGIYTATNLATEWQVLEQARVHGVRVMLSGWGGNEAASYGLRGYLPELLRRGRWLKFTRVLLALSDRRPKRLLWQLRHNALPPFLPGIRFRSESMDGQEIQPFIHPRLAEAARAGTQASPPLTRATMRSVRQTQLALLANGHITERQGGWAAWGYDYGIVYVYPLSDRRILEWIYRLPSDVYFHEGWGRYVYRAALTGILPETVRLRRSKYDPALETMRRRVRLRVWERLRAEIHGGLFDEVPPGWLDVERIKQAAEIAPDYDRLWVYIHLCRAVEVARLVQENA